METKDCVKIRFKSLKNGSKSVYFDIYVNGKRSYQFPKLYLIPDKAPNAKILNKNTMNIAEHLKAQLLVDLNLGKIGIQRKKKVLFSDFVKNIVEQKRQTKSKSSYETYKTVAIYINNFDKGNTAIGSIDSKYCNEFFAYLQKQPLKNNSIFLYFAIFKNLLNIAYKENLLPTSPQRLTSGLLIHKKDSTREYLTLDELKTLYNTPIDSEIKRAYLFSCFCGLRYSDIVNLKWDNIIKDGNNTRIAFLQQKTGNTQTILLNSLATELLMNTKKTNEYAFNIDIGKSSISLKLNKWATENGITKHITFHTARHTFATMELTLGADLYTVSKLLGHTNIATTQIYAKIIDKQKDDAIKLIDTAFENK